MDVNLDANVDERVEIEVAEEDGGGLVWESLSCELAIVCITANQDVKCLSAISETSWLWHRRLGHMHMEHLKDISSKELVRGLPKIKFEKDKMNL
ncbi:hypothetical protein RJ640_023385 [Escallonia rubra]|uniref:GAG-pre-integrase domain-containing protein n=1 Tax=Escallonia rubra TaxID=112253 RepID=A0AA88RGQ6_9ASTE|nr:hypothetical protein RJ640_023385 [Escallonia rubra]